MDRFIYTLLLGRHGSTVLWVVLRLILDLTGEEAEDISYSPKVIEPTGTCTGQTQLDVAVYDLLPHGNWDATTCNQAMTSHLDANSFLGYGIAGRRLDAEWKMQKMCYLTWWLYGGTLIVCC